MQDLHRRSGAGTVEESCYDGILGRTDKADDLSFRSLRVDNDRANQRHQKLGELLVAAEFVRLLDRIPGVVTRRARDLVGHRRIGVSLERGILLPAGTAALPRPRPVGKLTLRIADRCADRRACARHFRPDRPDQTLRRFTRRDVHLVHLLRFVGHAIHDLADLGRDAVNRELEGKAQRVVGGRLQHGDHLRAIDEAE